MFTGLIETVGNIKSIRQSGSGPNAKRTITVEAPSFSAELALGDSIAIAGACLTAVSFTKRTFTVEALGDTLVKTTLGTLRAGTAVNLERALKAGDRLDGHLVQGHVNGMAQVLLWEQGAHHRFLHVRLPAALAASVIPEGSIAIDGISLTIAGISGVNGADIRLSIIPHTYAKTTLRNLRPGSIVNIETDALSRQSVQSTANRRPALTLEKLAAWGYA
jgi:riboflavin synthase